MTKLLITSLLLIVYCNISAQVFEWAKSYDATNYDFTYPIDVKTDMNENVYILGDFTHGFGDNIDFDPGAGTFFMSTNGMYDIFLQKLDPNGNLLWAQQIGGTDYDYAASIAIDKWNNVYVTGRFNGAVDFDSSPTTNQLTSIGNDDIFILKLNTNGDFKWVKQIEGVAPCFTHSIVVDTLGFVYNYGAFGGIVDFDPSPSTFNMNSGSGRDGYILKLDSSGSFILAKQITGSNTFEPYAMTIDEQQNLYIAGGINGTTDFDPSSSTYNLLGLGAFVAKFDSSVGLLWATKIGTSNNTYATDIVLDNLKNVYSTGKFDGTVDFDPSASTYNLTGTNSYYIQKLDSNGNFIWARGGTNGSAGGNKIAIDNSANVYSTGLFSGLMDFDPGNNVNNLQSIGGFWNDIFIQKLDSSGNFKWIGKIGGNNNDWGLDITIDNQNNTYTVGTFNDTIDADHTQSIYNIISTSNNQVCVIHKMSPCPNIQSTVNITACDSFVSPSGKVWTTSNAYIDTTSSFQECDSIITFNLTINHSSSDTLITSSCYSYTPPSGNNIYYTGGTYYDTIPNTSFCDSIIIINLTIDSLYGHKSKSVCDSFSLPSTGHTYYSSGTYNDTIQNGVGCDSIIVYNIDIINNDTSITQNGTILTSNQLVAFYQWIDCNTSNYISGAINQSYFASTNGYYAVEITKNGCIDTSACHAINIIGIDEKNSNHVSIYPNPVKNILYVNLNPIYNNVTLTIQNVLGEKVYEYSIDKFKTHEIDFGKFKSGIYILNIYNNNKTSTYKIVKD